METLVVAILSHPAAVVVGQIILTSFFWIAGLFGIFNFRAVVRDTADFNLPAPVFFAAATVACQLIGSALIVTNFHGYGWFGAAMLAIFTLITIPVAHAFWKFEEPRRSQELYIAFEHITVIGALFLSAVLSVTT